MHWLINPIKYHYSDFSGRASRKEYWMFTLSYIIAAFVIAFAYAITVPFIGETGALLGIILILVLAFAIIIPAIAIQVRRLHDIGRSGWWYFIGFIPYLGGLALLIMSVLPSEAGSNEWGPNPYGIGTEAPPVPSTDVSENTTTSVG